MTGFAPFPYACKRLFTGAELSTIRPPRRYERTDYLLPGGQNTAVPRQAEWHGDLAVPAGTYAATLAETLPACRGQKAAR